MNGNDHGMSELWPLAMKLFEQIPDDLPPEQRREVIRIMSKLSDLREKWDAEAEAKRDTRP